MDCTEPSQLGLYSIHGFSSAINIQYFRLPSKI